MRFFDATGYMGISVNFWFENSDFRFWTSFGREFASHFYQTANFTQCGGRGPVFGCFDRLLFRFALNFSFLKFVHGGVMVILPLVWPFWGHQQELTNMGCF